MLVDPSVHSAIQCCFDIKRRFAEQEASCRLTTFKIPVSVIPCSTLDYQGLNLDLLQEFGHFCLCPFRCALSSLERLEYDSIVFPQKLAPPTWGSY